MLIDRGIVTSNIDTIRRSNQKYVGPRGAIAFEIPASDSWHDDGCACLVSRNQLPSLGPIDDERLIGTEDAAPPE